MENIYNGTGGNLTNGTGTATPSATNSEKVNVAGMHGLFCFECLCAYCIGAIRERKEIICLKSGFLCILDKVTSLVPEGLNSERSEGKWRASPDSAS